MREGELIPLSDTEIPLADHPEHISPEHGAPCWVNLMSRDLRSAQEFYAAVLGWHFRPALFGEEFAVALDDDGEPVAGIGALGPGWRVPVAWTPYFAVDDADETADRVRERGGTVAVGPLRFGAGRALLAADRDGAVFGCWEGRTLPWSVGRGSAPAVLELRTRDAFDAALFYGEVLGWAESGSSGCDVAYEHDHVVVRDSTHVVASLCGGALEAAPDPRLLPRWEMQVRVREVAAVAVAAESAGGAVAPRPPVEGNLCGRALIRDPDGAQFIITEA